METPEVGADVESICGKCGDVWHIVVAVVDEEIVKVQCKECDAYHKYRPPKPKKVAKKGVKTSKAKAAKAAKAALTPSPVVPPDTSLPVVPYVMTEGYTAGQRLEHAKFGPGHVEVATTSKIQVFFPDKRRDLIHGRVM